MLGLIEMSATLNLHNAERLDNNNLTMGQAARNKAISSKACREVVSLARESMGGNGILIENQVIKHMVDLEAIYTFEGTYDINSLISGRELTGGIAAFK